MFDIERIRTSWQREAAALEGIIGTINDTTAAEPIRSDGWTTHDLLGHIANAARGFLAYIHGDTSASIDIDAFNEERRERGRQRSWDEVQAYWRRTRDEVAAFLAQADASIGVQPVMMPHLPGVRNGGDALRMLIVHTRAHRQELEQGFPDVQA